MSSRITSVLLVTAVLLMFVVCSPSPTVMAAPVTQVTYPEKTYADGKARHFTHKTEDGVTIRYFIIRSSDSVIRAAFDACDVCWPENKGYSRKAISWSAKTVVSNFHRLASTKSAVDATPLLSIEKWKTAT